MNGGNSISPERRSPAVAETAAISHFRPRCRCLDGQPRCADDRSTLVVVGRRTRQR